MVAWNPTTSCEVIAAELQAKVPKLLQEGKLERTGRVIEKANKLCPQTTKDTWATAVDVAATLGKYKEAQALIKAIESATDAPENAKSAAKAAAERIARFVKPWPDYATIQAEQKKLDEDAQKAVNENRLEEAITLYEKEWEVWPPNGQALIRAGLLASQLGKKADARRYFDRALVFLEAKAGKASADVQKSFPAIETTYENIAFAPNGERIAVAHEHGLSFVETQAWREQIKLATPPGKTPEEYEAYSRVQITDVAYSPDGKLLVTRHGGGYLQLRDGRTGAPLGPEVKMPGRELGSIVFSPDGASIATHSRLWKIVNGQLKPSISLKKPGPMFQMAFSPDGKFIVGGTSMAVGLWDASTGARVRDLKGIESQIPYDMMPAFSPDGEFIAAGSSSADAYIRVWHARTGFFVRNIQVYKGDEDRKSVSHLVYTRDGKRIIAQYDLDKVGIWDAETGAKVLTMETGVKWLVDAMSLSPDGKKLVLGFRTGFLLVYDTTTGAKLYDSRAGNTANSAAFFPDGKRLVSGGGSTVMIWNGDASNSLRVLRGHTGDVTSVALSPDGKRVLSGSDGDMNVRLWDAETGAPLPSLAGHTKAVNAVAFSPDGKRIASASSDETVRIWDATTGASIRTLSGERGIRGGYGYAAVFSPNGKYVASKSEFAASVTDVESGALVQLHDFRNPIYGVAFTPGGSLVLGNNDDMVYIRLPNLLRNSYTFQAHEAYGVASSPDGKLIAAGHLTLANPYQDYAVIATLIDDGIYPVKSLAFSPKSDLLLSASRSGTLRLWRVKGNALLVRMDSLPGKNAGYLNTPSGEVDFLGADACLARDIAVCHIGSQSFPFEVCEDRFYAPGMLERVLSGESAILEPEIAASPLTCPRVP